MLNYQNQTLLNLVLRAELCINGQLIAGKDRAAIDIILRNLTSIKKQLKKLSQ